MPVPPPITENEKAQLESAMMINVTGRHAGLLWIRAMLLIFIIIFAAIQFFGIYQMIALVILIVGYFMLPSSYNEQHLESMALGWFRLILGVLIALLTFALFNGQPAWLIFSPALFISLLLPFTAATSVAGSAALSFLILAFFATPPTKNEREAGAPIFNFQFSGKIMKRLGKVGGTFNNLFYLLLVSYAVVSFLPVVAQSGSLALPVGLIIGLGAIMGYFAGSEGRPYVGVLVVGFAFLAFTFVYTGAVGANVFGAYWPQVLSAAQTFGAPIGAAFASISETMSDTQMMITCPSCYYAKEIIDQNADNAVVVEGGTVKSIEQTEFKAINWGQGISELDPTIPLIGSIQIENLGCFTAHKLNVSFQSLKVLDPKQYSAADTSKGYHDLPDKCEFTSCTGADNPDGGASYCNWTVERPNVPPGDLKLLMFQCGNPVNKDSDNLYTDWSTDLQQCACYSDKDTALYPLMCKEGCKNELTGDCLSNCLIYPEGACTKSDSVCPSEALMTYSYAGWMVTLPIQYDFTYASNVSMDSVVVMDPVVFNDKLLSKEIKLQSRESVYSGGPVKISLSVQDQPLRSLEYSYGSLSITNEGKGNLTNGTLDIWVPSDLTDIPLVSLTSTGKMTGLECLTKDAFVDGIHYKSVHCITTKPIAPEEIRTYQFRFKYNLTKGLESKTLGFRGTVDYNYVTVSEIQLPVTKAPVVG